MSDLIERLTVYAEKYVDPGVNQLCRDAIDALSQEPRSGMAMLADTALTIGDEIAMTRKEFDRLMGILVRYEFAFGNLQTLCGNNIDGDNLEAKVMAIVDNARSGR